MKSIGIGVEQHVCVYIYVSCTRQETSDVKTCTSMNEDYWLKLQLTSKGRGQEVTKYIEARI
ncbi:hypothetical protein HanXRQr2_Chr14g0647021 [Helianthus annuus]|uniref:Uncharacterized protein n=1 Tax=Helianthus annuus TaxID=4232 RepID=A0A9K3E8W2_HELAN|nr:hypothetical protein HanXRQr2_Chr14g0647021 [Helianthus annuus]KAJ0840612.1 hypothetical protein HanPSC8_Chr14g0620751 [Helianthus annuus]